LHTFPFSLRKLVAEFGECSDPLPFHITFEFGCRVFFIAVAYHAERGKWVYVLHNHFFVNVPSSCFTYANRLADMSCPAILAAETRPGVHDPASVSGKPYVAAATNLFSLLNNVSPAICCRSTSSCPQFWTWLRGEFSEIRETEGAY
jgi:hypothetical protein